MITSSRKLRRALVNYAFAFACLVILTLGAFAVTRDTKLSRDAILSAIGLNLIASVIFAVIFTLLSSRIQERSFEDNVAEGFTLLSRQLLGQLGSANRVFLPLAVYPPLEPRGDYGDPFNHDMTVSLEATSFYAFRGPSGRFVASRLMKARRHPQQVKVAMLSPGDRRAIVRRSSDRSSWARSAGKDAAMLERELHEELIMSVVALFDCRHICPIDLLYIEDTAVYRYEMFDDSIYISWYHSPRSSGKELPESFRFHANSFPYQSLRLDLIRRFEISQNKVTFDASQDEAFLRAHLTAILDTQVSSADIQRWRDAYRKYVGDFLKYLDGVYGSLVQHSSYGRDVLS